MMNHLLRRGFLVSCLAVTIISASWAQAPLPPPKTNFSGRWRMVKDKSDFKTFQAPDIIVRVIDQHDPTMNIHTVQTKGQKTTTADVSYYTDGAVANNVINGHDASSKSFWDGPDLVVRTDMKDSKNDDITIEDRYQLSQDGKTLTTLSHITTPKGEVNLTLVCEKEGES